MPTLRKNKGNRWMARVVIDGKQVACKMFPPGKKYGPEWRLAKEWEEAERTKALTQAGYDPRLETKQQREEEKQEQKARIHMGLERLFHWGEMYLEHAKRNVVTSTYKAKQKIMKEFFAFCSAQDILSLEEVTPAKCYTFLSSVNDSRGGHTANMFRTNMLTAWMWGMDFVDGFPQERPPFSKVKKFIVDKREKYVPPENDVIKVMQVAEGQDFVMLLFLYFTGARKSEVFRLVWDDIDFEKQTLRLRDHKTGSTNKTSSGRIRPLRIHPELLKALLWWKEARPCETNNVFMQTQATSRVGMPYKQRGQFMKRLCLRAGVKIFNFHAIRHKAAAITFTESGLNAAQTLMGHAQATTTNIYTKSAGLYSDQGDILHALGNSGIGQVVGNLLVAKIPQE